MVVNERPMKRMKRRIFADLYDFHTFPTTTNTTEEAEQPFRIKMRAFLEKHAHLTLSHSAAVLPSLFTWQLLLRVTSHSTTTHTNNMLSLYVVEEDVTRISSSSSRSRRSVYCDHCCVAGNFFQFLIFFLE